MQEGVIKVLLEGFGFIKTEGGDVFFHANNLVDVNFDDLKVGDTLSYELGEGRNGKEQAVNVQLVETEEAA